MRAGGGKLSRAVTFKETINRYKWSVLSASLLISFTLMLFGPLEIIMSEPDNFWFSVTSILPIVITAFLLVFILIAAVLFLSAFIGEKVFRTVFGALAGFGIAAYIQGNWMFVSYGAMDGTPIDWDGYGFYKYLNLLIWILIIGASVFLVLRFKDAHNILNMIAFIIVAVEAVTLVTVAVQNREALHKTGFTTTTEGQFMFSPDSQNILVILADGFDGKDFPGILEEEKDFRKSFDGFTYYPDTAGTSLYSEESAITLLTGNQLTAGPTFADNIKAAYDGSPFYDALEKNGYKTYLFVQSEKMIDEKTAGRIENTEESASNIGDRFTAFKKIYKMTMFRYSPHIMKPQFWYSTMEFDEFEGGNAYKWSNFRFRDAIGGINLRDDDSRVFQFVWIQGPHNPVVMDRYCESVDTRLKSTDDGFWDGQSEQQIGVVRIFTELLDGMKEAGVYDNTVIIITADHGWDTRPNPLLLIKPSGSRGELKTSYAPVSMIEDYKGTFMYFVTGEDDGNTIYDIKEGDERERPIYIYTIDKSLREYSEMHTEYYSAGAFAGSYRLGTVLDHRDIADHARQGIGIPEERFVWTRSEKAVLSFDLDEKDPGALCLKFGYRIYGTGQRAVVYANGTEVGSFTAKGPGRQEIVIPAGIVTDGRLEIVFELPDSVSPFEQGKSSDKRKLALAFTDMVIEKQE